MHIQLEQSKDSLLKLQRTYDALYTHNDMLDSRMMLYESCYAKDCEIQLNKVSELPETDIETVKEAIKC